MCDTEFYKPLDYDDQLLPDYLEAAVRAMDEKKLDVYGCLLMTLENGEFSERKWPHKPLETMFTGNSDDNMLPHSSVLMRTEMCRKAGNYQERAVGLAPTITTCGTAFTRPAGNSCATISETSSTGSTRRTR